METVIKRLYEAMFLVDSAKAAADWDGINDTIKTILEKYEAEIVSIRKWSERKLAYEINHKDRGTYILCYFRSNGEMISNIEREIQLSESVVRVLILNAEYMSTEDLEKDTPSMLTEKAAEQAVEQAAAKVVQESEVSKEASANEQEQLVVDKQVKVDEPADIKPEAIEAEADKEEPE